VPDSGDFSLDPGHYKLFWEGRNDHNIKHKVFWVDCPPGGAPAGGGAPAAGGGAAATPTPFNGATGEAPSGSQSNAALLLALLVSGGGAAAFVLVRPMPKGIRRD